VEILELLSDVVLTRERVRKLTLVHWSLKAFFVGEKLYSRVKQVMDEQNWEDNFDGF